jgi:NodT family efflux transporter outer membrane factor (OMF) lipoprotein
MIPAMPRIRQPSRLLAAALLAGLAAACTVGPNFKPPSPEVPAAWSAVTAAPAAGQASRPVAAPVDAARWWTSFNDAELTALIERAAAANLDAKAAVLRIAEARAQRDVTAAGEWPSLNANASDQINRLSQSTPTGALFGKVGQFGPKGVSIPNPYTQYQLGFDASWELDLFGRVRRQVEAAKAQEAAAQEDARDALVSLAGEVGRAYVDLRAAQAKRATTQAAIATEGALLDFAGQRRRSGLSSEVDVDQAAAEAASAKAALPLLERQISQDEGRLGLLLALPPGALTAELETAQPVPPVPPTVPVGLPADLARRRPDIRAAEARLHAAVAQQGAAIADLFPRVTLGGQAGLQSERLSTLMDWASRFAVAGPTVELPIFDAGRRRATVRLQDVRAREAALDYRRTVLSALHEVDDALSAYADDQARLAALKETVTRDQDAFDLARARYKSGLGDFIVVLDAQRTLQQNQLSLADATAAVSTDLVTLYKALGGGWG